MRRTRNIALVAHDSKKADMVGWAIKHREGLSQHKLWGTGTTGKHITDATGLTVTRLLSGPLGGDQQLGSMIAEGKIDVLIFFIDPRSSLPHDVDVKALLRISALYQTVLAINENTASHIMNSRNNDLPEESADAH